jgi:hypothetical protein
MQRHAASVERTTTMRTLHWTAAAVALMGVSTAAFAAAKAPKAAKAAPSAAASAAKRIRIFDGKPKVFIVNGYSTSFHWPRLLQRKLDRHFDSKRVITVRRATRGGTPIAKWIDVATGKPRPAWDTVKRALKRPDDKTPMIVLCQQSLQWVYAQRTEGIRGKDDAERIKIGADALAKYARLLKADGADLVFIAMHIYKKPMEPAIGNERLALAALLKRKVPYLQAGPDVWEPTSKLWPKAFAGDKVHPNSIGAEVMAHYWFEALLKYDGVKAPEWSAKEMNEAIAKGPVPIRRGGSGRGGRRGGGRRGGDRQPGAGRGSGAPPARRLDALGSRKGRP